MGGLSDGPNFFNPAKYLIPAGGIGKNGFSGPSLTLLASADKQTLVNGSVSVVFDDDQLGGVISDKARELLLDCPSGSTYENRTRLRLILLELLFCFMLLLPWTAMENTTATLSGDQPH